MTSSHVPRPVPPLDSLRRPEATAQGPETEHQGLLGDFSIDRLVSNRHGVLHTKFEVFSSLVRKRLVVLQFRTDG
jgi:hypothetical protein